MAKKEQEQTIDMIPVVAQTKDIKSLIYVVRGQQVMLDSDLAIRDRVCESLRAAHQISGRNNGMTKETGYNAIKPNRADYLFYEEAAV